MGVEGKEGGRWRIKLRTKVIKLIALTGADGDREEANLGPLYGPGLSSSPN